MWLLLGLCSVSDETCQGSLCPASSGTGIALGLFCISYRYLIHCFSLWVRYHYCSSLLLCSFLWPLCLLTFYHYIIAILVIIAVANAFTEVDRAEINALLLSVPHNYGMNDPVTLHIHTSSPPHYGSINASMSGHGDGNRRVKNMEKWIYSKSEKWGEARCKKKKNRWTTLRKVKGKGREGGGRERG